MPFTSKRAGVDQRAEPPRLKQILYRLGKIYRFELRRLEAKVQDRGLTNAERDFVHKAMHDGLRALREEHRARYEAAVKKDEAAAQEAELPVDLGNDQIERLSRMIPGGNNGSPSPQ